MKVSELKFDMKLFRSHLILNRFELDVRMF